MKIELMDKVFHSFAVEMLAIEFFEFSSSCVEHLQQHGLD